MALAILVLALAVAAVVISTGSNPHRSSARNTAAPEGLRPRSGGTHVGGRSAAAPPTLLAAVRPVGLPVDVRIAARSAGPAAPADFLGLSFELRSLPAVARYATDGDLAALLRSLGGGVMRFGGTSADEQVAWLANRAVIGGSALPRWASSAIGPRDLANLATLAHETGWRVLLTVNLGHYDPAAAAQEAAAAHAALGSALAGIEIGNEPDRYVRKGLRARGWAFAAYHAQAAAYLAAIAAAAPGVAIAGPDPASGVPGLAWLRAAARTLHPRLLTDHYYPLSSCGYRPTVGELLSANVRRADSAMLAKMLLIAHTASTPLRVDETNSVSCEGFPGVSDTFASALWALGYTARALTAGVAGLNFHDLLAKPDAYSPLVAVSPAALAAGALHAQPEWYALLAARELPGSRPLPASVTGATGRPSIGGELDASALRAPDGRLRLVLVDYEPPGSRPLAVRLQVPRAPIGSNGASRGTAYTRGSILSLTGPSLAATGGVKLAGRTVAPDGSWTPPTVLPGVYAHHGALSVELAPSSAAVVTLYPG